MIKITILTGFLGSGKTTLVNKLIEQNPDKKFGLIINEFGEIGVDAELVSSSDQEITEISNGCLCCVVRSDLIGAVKKMINTNKIDHILIETSGLAEPAPIAQSFIMDNIDGTVELESIICLIDSENFESNISNYKILKEQIETSDIAIINKIDINKQSFNDNLMSFVTKMNPEIAILENSNDFHTSILLDKIVDIEDKMIQSDINENYSSLININEKDLIAVNHSSSEHSHHTHNHRDHSDEENSSEYSNVNKEVQNGISHISNNNQSHNHQSHIHQPHVHNHHDHTQHNHDDHKHEHDEFDEVLYKSKNELDPEKLDKFFLTSFPKNVIRAKGFLFLKEELYLFQMVGANKKITPYTLSENSKVEDKTSYLVFIGKNIDKKLLLEQMKGCEIHKN